MQNRPSKHSERRGGLFLDAAHFVLGIGIVVLAVLSFINPEGNQMLFPLVFLLAAALNGLSGTFELKAGERGRKQVGRGLLRLLLTAFLLGMGMISAVSLWR